MCFRGIKKVYVPLFAFWAFHAPRESYSLGHRMTSSRAKQIERQNE